MSEDVPDRPDGYGPGSLLAGYRLESQVGAGGMAVVFRARDERLGRLVALKILSPALATDSAFRRRFIAESVAAAAVDDPHIIPVYEADEAGGVLFIAMRFVQGGDLREVLRREGRLSAAQAAEFISPVASALDAAHAAGLVHRDVKPGNILVDARPGRPDHVYLSDFGVSKGARSSGTLTGTGQFLGTPDYSAPEQIEGGTVDGRTDQYALACVAFQLLTGELPFQRDTLMAVMMAHMRTPPPPVSSHRDDLPPEVDDVIAKGMAKDPDDRYASCGDFADALREALGLPAYRPASSQTSAPRPVAVARVHEPTAVAETPAVAAAGTAAPAAPDAAAPAARPAGQTPPPMPAPGAVPASSASASSASAPPVTEPALAALPFTEPAPSVPSASVSAPPAPPASMPASSTSPAPAPPLTQPPSGNVPTPSAPSAPLASTPPVTAPARGPSPAPASPGTGPAASGSVSSAPRVTAPAVPEPAGNAGREAIPATVAVPSAETEVTDPGSRTAPPSGPPQAGATGTAAAAGSAGSAPPGWPPGTAPGPGGAKGAPGRRRLVSVAAAAVIVVAAGTIPFVLLRNGHTGSTGTPSGATTPAVSPGQTSAGGQTHPATAQSSGSSSASPSTASAAKYRLAARNVTSAYPGAFISSLAFGPAGTTLAVADPGPRAGAGTCLWHIGTTGCRTFKTNAYAVAFNRQGTVLATSGDLTFSGQSQATVNGITRLWNVATGAQVRLISNPGSRGALSVAFSPDGKTLAVGDRNGRIYLWDAAAGRAIAPLTDPVSKGVNSVAFSPDGATLAAADANGFCYLWHVAAAQVKSVLADPASKGADSVAFSPDGRTLASGDLNGRGYLWDVATGRRAGILDDPTATGALSVAFSPDGATLAVGDFSGGSRLWDVTTGKLIVTIPDPGGMAVGSVAFSRDGAALATGDAGGSVFVWHVKVH